MRQTPAPAQPGSTAHSTTRQPAGAFPQVEHAQHQEEQLQVTHDSGWSPKSETEMNLKRSNLRERD
jgi:hypothetical protein